VYVVCVVVASYLSSASNDWEGPGVGQMIGYDMAFSPWPENHKMPVIENRKPIYWYPSQTKEMVM